MHSSTIRPLFPKGWTLLEPNPGQLVASYVDNGTFYKAVFCESSDGWSMLTLEPDLRDDIYRELRNREIVAYRFRIGVYFYLTTNPKSCLVCEDCEGKGGYRDEGQKFRVCYSCRGDGYLENPLLGMATFDS